MRLGPGPHLVRSRSLDDLEEQMIPVAVIWRGDEAGRSLRHSFSLLGRSMQSQRKQHRSTSTTYGIDLSEALVSSLLASERIPLAASSILALSACVDRVQVILSNLVLSTSRRGRCNWLITDR